MVYQATWIFLECVPYLDQAHVRVFNEILESHNVLNYMQWEDDF